MSLFLNAEGDVRPGSRALAFLLGYPFAVFLLSLPFIPFLAQPSVLLGKGIELGAALGLTLLALKAERQSLRGVGLSLERRQGGDLVLGSVWGAGLQLLAAGLAWGLGGVRFQWKGLSASEGLWALALFAVVALQEELVFRGYAFRRLRESWGVIPAQVVFSGLLFAAVHLGNPNQGSAVLGWSMLNIALAGLLFGAMVLATGRLGLAVGAHFAWNLVQGPVLGFGVSGNPMPSLLSATPVAGKPLWLHGGAFGLEATLPCALVCAGAIAWWVRRHRAVEPLSS